MRNGIAFQPAIKQSQNLQVQEISTMTRQFLYSSLVLLASVVFVAGKGIESVSGEWSSTDLQLRLNCTLSPVDPAIGCLFIMLRHNSNETIESILVLPEISGCTVSDLNNISCCDIECSITSLARYVVYPVYEKGVVDTTVGIEGNVTETDNQLCTTTIRVVEESVYKFSASIIAGIGIGALVVPGVLIAIIGCSVLGVIKAFDDSL